jgi:hypothetical protein
METIKMMNNRVRILNGGSGLLAELAEDKIRRKVEQLGGEVVYIAPGASLLILIESDFPWGFDKDDFEIVIIFSKHIHVKTIKENVYIFPINDILFA